MKSRSLSDLPGSTQPMSPLYLPAAALNTKWPPKIYRQKIGVGSIGICSSLCSLEPSGCQLFVYLTSTGTCNLGLLGASLALVPTIPSGSEMMYTRKRE